MLIVVAGGPKSMEVLGASKSWTVHVWLTGTGSNSTG